MKHFFKHLLIIFGAALLFQVGTKLAGWAYTRSHTSFAPPTRVTTAVFGTSLGQAGINDSILSTWKNYCHSATAFIYHKRSLEKILSAENHIDTVVLIIGLQTYAVTKQAEGNPVPFERSHNNWNAQLKLEDFLQFDLKKNAAVFLTSDIFTLATPTPYGFRKRYVEYSPTGQYCDGFYNDKLRKNGNSRQYPRERMEEIDGIQHRAVRDIIRMCKERGIAVVILHMPTLNIKRWIAPAGYKDWLSTLDRHALIADYDEFPFPDLTYYADIHHLNTKGANYFCEHIKRHGLRLQTIDEYIKSE